VNTDGNNWEEKDYYPDGREQKALFKQFKFKNFQQSLEFVNKVGELAEKESHHPDINFGWGYASIWLTTHDAHGITQKDKDLASKIDKIIKD
jgi:4a-hydroxytetrahydrobiopterin dehydratase